MSSTDPEASYLKPDRRLPQVRREGVVLTEAQNFKATPDEHDSPPGPLRSAGYWLKMTTQAYLLELDTRLRPFGITHTQFTLLAAVGWMGKHAPPTQQQAATFAGIDRMMASKVLATLEAAGHIERRGHPHDARAKLLHLTAEGRMTLREAVQAAQTLDNEFFVTIDATGLRNTLRALLPPTPGR